MKEARLFARDGAEVHRTYVTDPAPPFVVCAVPDVSHRAALVPALSVSSPPPLHTLRFRKVGAEVDITGTWFRYEQDE